MAKPEAPAPGGVSRLADDSGESRFAYDGLDRVIHEKARLGIMTSLVTHKDGLLFGDLRHLCSLTDGNLSRHLAILQEAGLVAIEKGYRANRPQTRVRITAEGRARYLGYLDVLEQVVRDAAAAARDEESSSPGPLSPGRLVPT